VVLSTSGDLSDTWDQANWQGLITAAKPFNDTAKDGFRPIILSFSGDDPLDPTALTAKLDTFGELGISFLVNPENDIPLDTIKFSQQYPNIYVLGNAYPSNYTITGKNAEYTPDYYFAYYPIGILSGLLTKTNTVGFITGFWFQSTAIAFNAFKAGVLSVCPTCKVLYATTDGDWADPVEGASAASGLISAGADVVCGYGDGMTNGIIEQANSMGVKSFGYLFDQSALAPNSVVSSSVWNTTTYFTWAFSRIFNGTYGGQDWDDPYLAGLAPIASWVPTSIASQATTAMSQISAGTLKVPVNSTSP
jgi:basic membrane lipoprotein Med (substrate-binding protein (PBP1-ABC) superfamily)